MGELDIEVLGLALVSDRQGEPDPTRPAVVAAIEAALGATELKMTRTRKGRESVDDIRPALCALEVVDETDRGVAIRVELNTRPVSARPKEVVAVLGDRFAEGRVLRIHQWIERDGARLEPLNADTRPRVPEACAS